MLIDWRREDLNNSKLKTIYFQDPVRITLRKIFDESKLKAYEVIVYIDETFTGQGFLSEIVDREIVINGTTAKPVKYSHEINRFNKGRQKNTTWDGYPVLGFIMVKCTKRHVQMIKNILASYFENNLENFSMMNHMMGFNKIEPHHMTILTAKNEISESLNREDKAKLMYSRLAYIMSRSFLSSQIESDSISQKQLLSYDSFCINHPIGNLKSFYTYSTEISRYKNLTINPTLIQLLFMNLKFVYESEIMSHLSSISPTETDVTKAYFRLNHISEKRLIQANAKSLKSHDLIKLIERTLPVDNAESIALNMGRLQIDTYYDTHGNISVPHRDHETVSGDSHPRLNEILSAEEYAKHAKIIDNYSTNTVAVDVPIIREIFLLSSEANNFGILYELDEISQKSNFLVFREILKNKEIMSSLKKSIKENDDVPLDMLLSIAGYEKHRHILPKS